ncbi:ovarian cancer G-protein coupled receptor 1-like [Brachyistius frenatus]|uniref:ovarian cancer G-protein coupled receptor 1-like n=1 Tax=Brachyistius frenatus TaxID=100188 RepID=UPI0037E8133E
MAKFMNNTSQDQSYNYGTTTSFYEDDHIDDIDQNQGFFCYTVELGYIRYVLVRRDHVAPIYVINLLVSDLLQLCCMLVWVATSYQTLCQISTYLYNVGVMASVGFMVCISLERYLVVAWPLWYRFRRPYKVCLVVCAVVWTLPLVYLLTFYFLIDFNITETIGIVFILLPLPLLTCFLCGAVKALSATRSVSLDEKRRIVATLVAVLLIYILLFLPRVIWSLVDGKKVFLDVSLIFVNFSPLVDVAFYVFIRKGTVDKFLASLCRCTMGSDDVSTSTV